MIEAHVVARLIAAAGLGALVGLEREASDQPAGLRTHMSVALGAALFGVISTVGFDEFRSYGGRSTAYFQADRVASTVVTGIGFLGAGIIFRRGATVHNLTTAASLWVVAAVGLSCGVGDIGPAAVSTVILLAALALLRAPKTWVRRHLSRDDEPVRIVLAPDVPDTELVALLHDLDGVSVHELGLEKQDGAIALSARLRADRGVDLRARLVDITRRPDVVDVRIGDAD